MAKLHPPICYYPIDLRVKGIEEQVRQDLAKRMLEEKVISQAVYEKLVH